MKNKTVSVCCEIAVEIKSDEGGWGLCSCKIMVDWRNVGDANATCARTSSSGNTLVVAVAKGSGYSGV